MAGQYPAPLPSLGLNLAPSSPNVAGAPAYLPSIGLVLGTTGGRSPLAGAAGAFVLTGQAAALKSARKVVSATGSFAETGVAATLTKSGIAQGGDAAPLPSIGLMLVRAAGDKIVFAADGAFTLTGIAAVLNKGRAVNAAVGSFLLNGAPALRDMQVTADKATFALTTVAATLKRASQGITANVGTFALTGIPAGLTYQTVTVKSLAAAFGQFVVTGVDAALPTVILRKIVADTGSFAVTGHTATITAVHWAPQGALSSTWTNVNEASTTWNNA